VAASFAVPPGARPLQLAELRARVLETMAAMKQATGPWQHPARSG
jgi:hypothetical protein